MPITWGGITFSGPVRLTTWIAQNVAGIYAISINLSGGQIPVYFGESENLAERGINENHHSYQCWLREASSEQEIYISVYSMADSTEEDRRRVEQRLINQYNPICNE